MRPSDCVALCCLWCDVRHAASSAVLFSSVQLMSSLISEGLAATPCHQQVPPVELSRLQCCWQGFERCAGIEEDCSCSTR